MKTWILALALLMGTTMSAQKHGGRHSNMNGERTERHKPLTPGQRAELKAKKLTLELDLTDKQQAELKKVFTAQATERQQVVEQHKANREAGKKLTDEERFALKTKKLDAQIATKRELKKILSEEQFAKFEKMKKHRHEKITKRAKKMKKHHRR
jgi:periplasmic protein CpxP/Spy